MRTAKVPDSKPDLDVFHRSVENICSTFSSTNKDTHKLNLIYIYWNSQCVKSRNPVIDVCVLKYKNRRKIKLYCVIFFFHLKLHTNLSFPMDDYWVFLTKSQNNFNFYNDVIFPRFRCCVE